MSDNIISNVNDDINHFNSSHRYKNSIFLRPSTLAEVEILIENLKRNKSPGFDNISVRILKSCSNIISPIISKLRNLIFETSIYPNSLAKTIPVFKSGDSKLMINYSPISVLSILNKIIEQLIYKYGFRSKSSTKTATTILLDKILNVLNKGEIVTGIFVDLAKAFDTVNHKILMKKLEIAGVRGLKLFESYLSNRNGIY